MPNPWPELPAYSAWKPACDTLHLWTQIVGKIRLARAPWLNHGWHVTLHVTPRGLTTGPIPWDVRSAEITFDFVDHRLRIAVDDAPGAELALGARSVADFHAELMDVLTRLGLPVDIDEMPNEMADPILFSEDQSHAAYEPKITQAFHRALIQADRVFKRFRTGFLGKASPSHFFWGSFDLAVTRFSGRRAPPHPGGVPGLPDAVTREAYSHEVSSAGFWPGGGPVDEAAFYAYAYPSPDGFKDSVVRPAEAVFHEGAGEFILPYQAVRDSRDPEATLMDFLQSTYDAAADLGGWDRGALECAIGRPGVVRVV